MMAARVKPRMSDQVIRHVIVPDIVSASTIACIQTSPNR
jgi:hypothetical protein